MKILVVACFATLLLSNIVKAELIIDSFDTPQSLSYSGSPGVSSTGVVNGLGMIGGQRESQIHSDPFGSGLQSASLDISSGFMTLQVSSGTHFGLPNILAWDGTGESFVGSQLNGLGNLNLTTGDATAIVFSNVSSTIDLSIQLTMLGASGTNGGFASVAIPSGTSNGTFLLPYSAFGAQADFTNVGAIELGFSSISAPGLLSIGQISTNATAVPEPSSALFFFVTTSILALKRMRRNR